MAQSDNAYFIDRYDVLYDLYEANAENGDLGQVLNSFKDLYQELAGVPDGDQKQIYLAATKAMIGDCLYTIGSKNPSRYREMIEGVRYVRDAAKIGNAHAIEYLKRHEEYFRFPKIVMRLIKEKDVRKKFLRNPPKTSSVYVSFMADAWRHSTYVKNYYFFKRSTPKHRW